MKKKNLLLTGGVLAASALALGTGFIVTSANENLSDREDMYTNYMSDQELIDYASIEGFEVLDFEEGDGVIDWLPIDLEMDMEAIIDEIGIDITDWNDDFLNPLDYIIDEEFLTGHIWLNNEWVAIEELPADLQAIINEVDELFDQIADANTEDADELYLNPRIDELLTQIEEMIAELEN